MKNIIKYLNDNFWELSAEKIEELTDLIESENDFYFELEGGEWFRFIHNSEIEDTFYNSCVDLLEECYFNKDNEFLQRYIDYDGYVRDCSYDWYGVHFSSYDWSEEYLDEYYIFRTN